MDFKHALSSSAGLPRGITDLSCKTDVDGGQQCQGLFGSGGMTGERLPTEVETDSCKGSQKKDRQSSEDGSVYSDVSSDYDALSENYLVGQVLGTGGFGEVRAGRRKSDHLPVAIKRIKRQSVSHSMSPPNDTESVPLELALMQLVSRPPACPAVIQLLDWVITQSCVFLVMERPDPCMDLFDFMWERGQCLTEPIAGSIFRQVVQAVHHCQSRGVLHRDIKPENILVETSTQQTKLIDFGCGTLLNQKEYTSFTGTHFYAPPEWCLKKSYEAEPATVWSLGVLLFEMLCGQVPFKRKEEVIRCNVIYTADISKECASLIKKCLSRSPKERPTLEEILMHPWVC